MRILVYGAGVLGGYLAHVLHRGGNDVTLLARGAWKTAIDGHGLIIRHYAQMKTTTDHMRTVYALAPDDIYDIIFIVMQFSQLPAALPSIAANRSKLVVFVGNNMAAEETKEATCAVDCEKKVLFGFQSSAGRRERDRIISVRLGGKMTLGSLDGDKSSYEIIRQAFRNARYTLAFTPRMDAWLKCHAAFVLPVCYICHAVSGNLRKADKALINRAIDASSEGYAVLETLNIPIEPAGCEAFVREERRKCYAMLKALTITPLGRLLASDHAMSATGEMRALSDAFDALKMRAGIATPAWDELERHMPGMGGAKQ